ncbi:MAG: TonB-dependent receptor [Gemmatimonadaceae bacterium]|jgi:outer membrane receptor protein involved in Fe transport|nr:TonB-dependent receptor [Gemmatimonadaceae bacterium]
MRSRLTVVATWLIGGLGTMAPLRAQSARATVTGVVRAPGGRPIAGARVRQLQPATSDSGVLTDTDGRFTLAVSPALALTLEARALGFLPRSAAVGPLAAGARRDLAITLEPRVQLNAVAVTTSRDRPLINTLDASTGAAVERAELERLPTDARDPLALLFNIPGVAQSTGFFGDAPPLSINGQNSLYTPYLLDGLDNTEGFLGGPRVEFPLAGIARLDAMVNTYSTEFGRSGNGVINTQTLAGGNRTQWEVVALNRPGRPLDARNKLPFNGIPAALERQQDGFTRSQFGAAVRGALRPDRTFYSTALEYTDETEDRIGSTALAPFLGTERRQKVKAFARLDHGWSSTQSTTLRAAGSLVDRQGNGSGVVTPEADITTRREGILAALTHRSALRGATASNTASIQLGTFKWYFPPTASDFSKPQVTVITPDFRTQAVVGSSNFVFDNRETQWQFRDVVEAQLGSRHALRAGVDVVTAGFKLFAAGTNPNGAYTVFNDGNIQTPTGRTLGFADIPATARVQSYTIDAQPQQVDLRQTVYGAFVEDRWTPRSDLTLIAGLRWDYDDMTGRGESSADLDNLQPRLSFNWQRSTSMVVRGGVGAYSGKLPYAIYSDAIQLGPQGNAVVSFAGSDAPAYLRGPTPQQLRASQAALPPREVFRTFATGLRSPMSYQSTLGTQVELARSWGLSLDGVWVETRDLPWSIDLNPVSRQIGAADVTNRPCTSATSCPADQFRALSPRTTGYRRLNSAASGGTSRYLALYSQLRKRLSSGWAIDANWTLSRAQTDAEDINFAAINANCFRKDRRDVITGAACTSDEWADANNDRRHKVTVRSVHELLDRRLRLAVIGDFQSGQPINRVAGVAGANGVSRFDLLGTGGVRGSAFTGNSDRFFGVPRNGERLPGFTTVNLSGAYALPTRRGDLEVRAELFNLFNATNWSGFASGIGGGGSRTQFGRPGDPVLLFSPGTPRQVQLTLRWAR